MKKIITTIAIGILFSFNSIKAQTHQLWGMTHLGGINNMGTIIRMQEDGTNFQTVFSFDSVSGAAPEKESFLLANNGLLYGTTISQGLNNYGTIFSFDTSNNTLNVVYDFMFATGASPESGLIQANNGKLYGIANQGGANSRGVLFKFDPTLNLYSDIYDFTPGSSQVGGGLIQANNNLIYGIEYGGGAFLDGCLFSYDFTNDTVIDIFDFNDTLGKWPIASLIQGSDGKLYGMANRGGLYHAGVIFSFDILNGIYVVLHHFNGTMGQLPSGSLLQASNNKLYGTAFNGGANNIGVLFSYDIANNTYDTLHNFKNISGGRPDGSLIQGNNGKLYGMASNYGANNVGTIFSYDIGTNTYFDLHDFSGLDGSAPFGGLIEVTHSTVNIPIIKDESGISIYPNPTSTTITIHQSTIQPNQQLTITDVFGRIVFSQLLTNTTESTIDITNLSNGIYFYEVASQRGKIVKQ